MMRSSPARSRKKKNQIHNSHTRKSNTNKEDVGSKRRVLRSSSLNLSKLPVCSCIHSYIPLFMTIACSFLTF
jgi:hypothetical protein